MYINYTKMSFSGIQQNLIKEYFAMQHLKKKKFMQHSQNVYHNHILQFFFYQNASHITLINPQLMYHLTHVLTYNKIVLIIIGQY